MIRRIFSIAVLILVLCSNFSQIEARDDLADMYANPGNYIRYGGASIGMSFLIDRSSVETSGDMITAREIVHHSGMQDDISLRKISYRYDLNEGKFYRLDSENWIYVDPAKLENYHAENYVAAGEILFYLAYHEKFFEKPISNSAKFFIEENRSLLPLVNLPNGGDGSIWHVYNHSTHEIEWWKYLDDGFRRVK